MICYHGTTRRRADRICEVGFLPRKPSKRVWFAQGRGYAERRARQQARRAHDRPVVLTCDVNVHELRERIGARKVMLRNGILAVNSPMPVTVLRSHPASYVPVTPEELAQWVNELLGVKPYKGVGRRHPGIERLSRWVSNRLTSEPNRKLTHAELVPLARQWLPEYFEDVEIDPAQLSVTRRFTDIAVDVGAPDQASDPREDEALDCLLSARPRRRVRGLNMLAELEDADALFDWCVMHLDDESTAVRVAALRTMLVCEDVDVETVEALAADADKRVRGSALAVLGKHDADRAPAWFERGLKDPAPCVRLTVAAQLPALDAREHHGLFELALHDPNPHVARAAERLTAGKGYAKAVW